MPKKFLIVLATIAMWVGGVAGPASAAPRATTVTIVKPVDRYQVLEPGWTVLHTFYRGTCYEGSDTAIPGVDRCFVGNYIHDPCWPTVNRYGRYNGSFCPSAPWSHHGVLIKGHHHADTLARGRRIWGIALPSGNRCSSAEGAGLAYKGRRVSYYCQHDRVALVGRPSKATSVWHILAIKNDKHNHVIAHWDADIVRAWVAVSPYGG